MTGLGPRESGHTHLQRRKNGGERIGPVLLSIICQKQSLQPATIRFINNLGSSRE